MMTSKRKATGSPGNNGSTSLMEAVNLRRKFYRVRVATVLKKTFPEVNPQCTCLVNERVVEYKDKLFSEKNFIFSDPSFF